MKKRTKIAETIKPLEGVIYFMIILIISHYVWKFFVIGDESNNIVTIFGANISKPFIFMSEHIATITNKILNMFGLDTTLQNCNVITNGYNKTRVEIVWSCTGIKQSYIFFCIIAFYKGSIKHKLWFIPLGLIIIYVINLIRISGILAVVANNPANFELWHNYITKYLFYIIIFFIWVVWDKYFANRK